jgi:hypothetical protein
MIQSMVYQFAGLGLRAVVSPVFHIDSVVLDNLAYDWNFGDAVHLDASWPNESLKAYQVGNAPEILLIAPAGKVVKRWNGVVASVDIWLTLRRFLGTPAGMQNIPFCSMDVNDEAQRFKLCGAGSIPSE